MSSQNIDTSLNRTLSRHMAESTAAPAVLVVDPEDGYRICHASASCKYLGKPQDGLHGAPLTECVPTLTLAKLAQIWREIKKSGASSLIETDFRTALGQRLAIEITFSQLDNDGQPLMVGYLRDISERRVLESECQRIMDEIAGQEIELRYRELFENVTDGIFLLDVIDGERFTFAGINPALARISGLVPMNIIGRFVEDVVPADAARIMNANYRHCLDAGKPINYEVALDLPTGRKILESTLVPVRDGFGNVHRIIGLTSDITAKKAAERELGFMNYSLDHMHDAVFLIDSQLRFRYVNDRACQSLGYSREWLLDMRVPDIDPIMNEADAEAYRKQIHEQGFLRFETFHHTKDGRAFPVEISATVLQYDGEEMSLCVARDISERKQYEAQLHRKRLSLIEAQRIAHLGSWELDLTDNTLNWSDEIFRIFEIDAGEFGASYEAFIDTVHPDDREAVNLAYAESLKNRTPYEIEHRLLMADGRIKYVVERCETQYAEDGTPLSSLGTVQDITEQKLAEVTLQESQERMRLFFERQVVGMAITSPEKGWLQVNDKVCEMLGYSRDELQKLSWADLTHPEDIAIDTAQFERLLDGKADHYTLDKRFIRKDGSVVFTKLAVACVRRADRSVDYVLAMLEDVTWRKMAENSLKESEARYRTSSNLLHAIFESSPDVITFALDKDYRYLAFNARHRQVMQQLWGRDIAVGMNMLDIIGNHPDREAAKQGFDRALAGESFVLEEAYGDERLSRKHWQNYWSPIRTAGGEITGLTCFAMDITQRKQVEAQLQQSLEFSEGVIHAIPDLLFEADADGRYLNVWAHSPELLAAQKEALLGRTVHDVLSPEAAEITMSALREANETGLSFGKTICIDLPQGERWFEISVSKKSGEATSDPRFIVLSRDITERKQMEFALQQREREFRSLAESSPDVIVRFDRECRRIYANPTAAKLAGKPAEAMLGSTPADRQVLGTEHAEKLNASIRRVFASGQREQIELAVTFRDGSVHEYDSFVVPEFNADGQVTTVLNLSREVTSIRAAERKLAHFVDNLPGMAYTFRLSPDGAMAFTYLSRAVRDIYGLTEQEAMADFKTVHTGIVPAEDIERIEAAIVESVRNLSPKIVEFRIRRPDAPERWLEARSLPERQADNGIVWHGIMLDITARKQVEAERHQLLDILDQSTDYIGRANLDGTLGYHNRAARRMLGLPEDADISGMRIADMHPEWAGKLVEETVLPALHENSTWRGESALLHRDGHEIPVSQLIMLHRDAEGRPLFTSTIMTDISEQKRIENTLKFVAQRGSMADEESFQGAMARYLAQVLGVNYVIIARLADDPAYAETVAFYGRGEMLANMQYALASTPCHNAMHDGLVCYPANVRQLFPDDHYLGDMQAESYAGLPLWDSNGKAIGLIAVLDDKPMLDVAAIISLLQLVTPRVAVELEREQHDEALRRQQEALTAAQRVAQVGSWEIDHAHERHFWSDEMFRIFEIDPAEGASYDGCMKAIHPDDREAVERAYFTALAAQVPYKSEHRLLMADGRIKYVHERSETTYAADGKPLRSLGMVQDITERKQHEAIVQERLELERRLSHMADHIPGFLYTYRLSLDGRGSLPFASAGIRDIYGLQPEDVAEDISPLGAITHPDDRQIIQAAADQSLATLTPFHAEYRVFHPTKGMRWVEDKGTPVLDIDGSVLYHGVMLDITERKRVEETLRFVAQRGWAADGESFLTGLARYLGRMLEVDYVIIGKLADDAATAETIAIHAKGEVLPNIRYSLQGTPCDKVMEGELCCHLSNVQQRFPEDTLLVEMQAESYAGIPLWDSTGKVIGLIAVMDGKPMQDAAAVTSLLKLVATRVAAELERERSVHALAESRQFLQQVIDTIADPVFVKDSQHRWLLLNRAFCGFMGQPLETLLGKSDYDFFPRQEADVFWEKDELVLKQGGNNVNEEAFTDADGLTHTILTTKTSFADANGERILVGSIKDITALKQTQWYLEETAGRLNSLVQTLPDYIWMKDANGVYLACNHAFEKLYGASEAEILGKTDYDFVEKKQADFFRQKDKEAMEAGAIRINEEWVALAETGQRILLETRKVPVYAAGSRVIGVLGIGRDITERKQNEAALRRSEQLMRTIIDATPDWIFIKDREHRYRLVNKGYADALHIAPEAFIGKNDLDLGFPEELVKGNPEKGIRGFWADDHLVLESNATQIYQDDPATIDGTVHTFHTIKVPLRDTSGTPWGVLAFARDITERKQAERALAEREREFRTLAENTSNLIIRYDCDGRRIYVNPAYERAIDATAPRTARNLTPEQIWLPTNITADEYMAVLRRIRQTGEREELVVERTLPDGRLQSYSFTMTPEADEAGNIVGVLAIGHDISGLKASEELLRQREREFRTLVENLPTYVVRLDQDLRHVYANPAYVAAVGLSEATILDAHVSRFWHAENVSVDAYIALLTRVLWSGVQEEVTLEWRDKAGRLFSHLVRVAPEFAADGAVQGLLILGFDITEHSRQLVLEAERQRVFETIAHGGELNETLDKVARYVESAKPGRYCCILLLDEEQNHLISAASPSLSAPCQTSLEGISICEESGCCSAAVLLGERVVADDIAHPDCPANCQTFARENGVKACWSEPIIDSSGNALGVVVIYLEKAAEADSQDVALLRHAGYLSSIAIERKRIEARMHHQASYDSLTGLPNRLLFGHRLREEMTKAGRGGENLALFFIDLDRFKEVNDTLGHEIGDLLLTKAAQRIRACVRESDTVARLGGDEFVVILTQVDDISYLGRLAQSIVDEMAQPFYLGEHTAYISASIGIAGYPLDADNAESLIGCADQAMYAAKELGRNNFSFFTATMQQQVQARMLLANDLRDALEKQQLHVWYQPIVDIATGEVVKAEALLRWKHPLRGMVPPDQFIPVAEENGLIHDIGDWVFRQAVEVGRRWNADGKTTRQISVNLSPRQFVKGHFDAVWLEHLKKTDTDPAYITIEITEGLLLDDRPEIMEKLARLGMAGMQVALDDFGTGYSAMAYLKKFPIDYLKIDRSFVRDLEIDPGDRAIAEAIVAMAHKLGLKTIAEGVETAVQRDILAAVGCEYVQGYFYAKPMDEDAFMKYLGI